MTLLRKSCFHSVLTLEIALLAFFVLLSDRSTCGVFGNQVRGSIRRTVNATIDLLSRERELQAASISNRCRDESFYVNKPCLSWKQFIGTTTSPYAARVVIPCGVCVELRNTAEQTLIFNDGIDVQGKLLIDCNSAVGQKSKLSTAINIQTTLFLIQGRLKINSSCKPIDGKPLLKVHMKSKDTKGTNSTFVSIHDPINVFCSRKPCNAGEKGITVAGGQVDILGIPAGTPSWLHLYNVTYTPGITNPTGIIVQSTVKGTWAVGATILITSFTTRWDQFQQVRTIVGVRTYDILGRYVELKLNESIVRPTTVLDSPDFAVEVALLSKNIAFTADDSEEDTVGGHFWFFHTSNLIQKVTGIDIQNFGQQGRLGRYPIHFHHCWNVTGSFISKNTIRQSNQRCVVIHGTNDMQISENVAFDTAGHCFMLEDGIETGNNFIRNLGAMTRNPKKVIPNIPSSMNGFETDGTASTFWITNPTNRFWGNVAAGSQHTGYWFELLKRGSFQGLHPNINPSKDNLTLFEHNVAHSNGEKGFRTYRRGYDPLTTARFTGIKAYRNAKAGLLLHITSNIIIEDSIFADNGIGVDLDRTMLPTVLLQNISIIGESISFRDNVRLKGYDTVCGNENNGVEMRTWKEGAGEYVPASIWDNVKFSRFNHGSCAFSSPIKMKYYSRDGPSMFDFFSTMKSVSFSDVNQYPMDFCSAERDGVVDIYMTDLDNSLKPSTATSTATPSTLISLLPNMQKFVNRSKCFDFPSQCLSYCQETCFRGVIFDVDPAFSDYKLKICQKGSSTNCIVNPSYRRTINEYLATIGRQYPAYMPIGEYDAVFLDAQGNEAFPNYVRQSPIDSSCPNSGSHVITYKEPPVTNDYCNELIKNGDFEASTVPKFWLTDGRANNNLTIVPGAGIGGSNALSTFTASDDSMFVQYLDTRCWSLMAGGVYRLHAEVKLIKADGKNYICDPKKEKCPEIGILTTLGGFWEPDYERRKLYIDSSYNGNLKKNISDYETFTPVATVSAFASRNSVDGFMTLEGDFRIPEGMLNTRFSVQASNYRLVVDNVSMKLIEPPAPTVREATEPLECKNMIGNSDMELGSEGYWTSGKAGAITTTSPGHNSATALLYKKSILDTVGPTYTVGKDLIKTCLTQSISQLKITTQIKIVKRLSLRNIGSSCDVNSTCPAVRIQIYDDQYSLILSTTIRSYTSTTWNPDGFNTFESLIEIPRFSSATQSIGQIELSLMDSSTLWELIWDDFVVQPLI